jgi:hypothetical protein
MKKTIYVLLLLIFVCMSCSQDEAISTPEIDAANLSSPVGNDHKSLAKQVDIQKYQRVAKVMAANNLGQGAYFIEPTDAGYRLGIAKNVVFVPPFSFISGEFASFEGSYGKGDFWRTNPDGTVSVKLTTNQALAGYFNIETGEFYSGTGNMNTKFTYTSEEYCYVDEVTGEESCFTFLYEDPNNNALVIHGNAALTLNGAGGKSRMLQMWQNVNPGGGWDNARVDFNLK